MTASSNSASAVAQPKRSFGQVLRSYFYWTYSRGSFHYDIMVTLILLFIFITPQLWDYGAKPSANRRLQSSFSGCSQWPRRHYYRAGL